MHPARSASLEFSWLTMQSVCLRIPAKFSFVLVIHFVVYWKGALGSAIHEICGFGNDFSLYVNFLCMIFLSFLLTN